MFIIVKIINTEPVARLKIFNERKEKAHILTNKIKEISVLDLNKYLINISVKLAEFLKSRWK